MAKSLVFKYRFNPGSDSITVDGNISPKRVLLITNTTDNIILFNFADTSKKILSSNFNPSANETTFVLQYDCAAMDDDDTLQIFIEQDFQAFEPGPTFTDPVSKFRVSQPNTLIDTDFEYGLQATKWETLERVNDVPAFHSIAGDIPLSGIISITTTGTRIVTVTTSTAHGLVTGTPIDVRGVDSPTAEGTFIVKRTADLSFTYEARAVQPGTASAPAELSTPYINVTSGRFYVGSQVVLDNTVANTTGMLVTNGNSPSSLTAHTEQRHGFPQNSTFYLVNSLANLTLNFSPISLTTGAGDVDDRIVLAGTGAVFTATTNGFNLQVSAMTSGVITIGMQITGGTLPPGCIVTAYNGGVGGTGQYTISISNTNASPNITYTATSYGTGFFLPSEPFHDGVTRREITQLDINISTSVVTMLKHQLVTGDMIAYVGTSAGGSIPQVNSNTSSWFNYGGGQLPQYGTTVSAFLGKFMFVNVLSPDTFKVYMNPKDAYADTSPLVFNGIGQGSHSFALFKRGRDIVSTFATIASTSGSSEYVVTLNGLNTCQSLGIYPKRQITVSGADVTSLNGVYRVISTSYQRSSNSFRMIGPTNTSGVDINAAATQSYTMLDSGANGSTSFNRYDDVTGLGIRVQLHDDPLVNRTRVSYDDWKSKNAKFFTLQHVGISANSDAIYIKNHGLDTGEPVMFTNYGQANTGGANVPVSNSIYFVNKVDNDSFTLHSNENVATLTGPYATATANLTIDFSAMSTISGGFMSIHPGFTVNNTTVAAAGGAGAARDRLVCLYQSVPADFHEGQRIILKTGSGSTWATGIVNTPDNVTSYQPYYVRNVWTGNNVIEFSISLAPEGATVDFTGNSTSGSGGTTTAGGGRFICCVIDENPLSNSFFLQNHGGVGANQRVGGNLSGSTDAVTGVTTQGTFPAGPDYPGPLFDLITDATGSNWPKVRTYVTTPNQTVPGLTNASQYYMIPINNDVFKVQLASASVLPSGNPTVQITGITVTTNPCGPIAFASPFVQNINANRIIVPVQNQVFVDGAVVRYRTNGGSELGSGFTGYPGLSNNNSYIIRGINNNVIFNVAGTVSAKVSSLATSIILTSVTGLSIGDTIRINREFLLITNIVSFTLTVTRATRSTTAAEIPAGSRVEKLYGSFQLFETTQGRSRILTAGPADTANDWWTINNHNLKAGETVSIASTAGGNIGLFFGTTIQTNGTQLLYAIVYNANTFGLALTPALAFAQYPVDVTVAGTAWNFIHYYNAIPFTGLASGSSQTFEDVSSTGTLDGGYTATTVGNNTFALAAGIQVPNRVFYFEPADTLVADTGEFQIRNHGYITGTKVRYSRGALAFAIGEGAVPPTGNNAYSVLIHNTDYFVIRTGLDSFQLATTKANALARIPITEYASLGSAGAHTFTTDQVYGESLSGGLATIVARDVVVNGSLSTVVQAASDRIVFNAHGLTTGDRVTYRVWAGGRAINGLVNGRQYFVNNTQNLTTTRGGAGSGQQANQFSLHNTWVGAYTNTDLVDMLGVGFGTVHQFKVSNPTLRGTVFKGEWNSGDTYVYGDVVLYNNTFFMSTVSANNNEIPIAVTTGLDSLRWQRCPTLPSYNTRFLVSYRGGSRIRISNQIVKRSVTFNGTSAANFSTRVITINGHNLQTGDAVRYEIDAIGGNHQGTTPATGNFNNIVNTLGTTALQTPIQGLVANRIYYVNRQDANNITLHNTYPEAIEGGSAGGDAALNTAVAVTAASNGTIHRFALLENVVYDMSVLSVTNDFEMIVTDPYDARQIQFNPQDTFIAPSGLVTPVVNTVTREFYLPNHGLDTGVKVIYTFGLPGSGTAIGGLVDGASYYVIKKTKDTIMLAANENDCLRLVPVAVSSTGAGFQHYLIAATAFGNSAIKYDNTGQLTTNVPGGTLFYTGQQGSGIRNGVLQALPIMQETELYVRPDCTNVHRPFDGGVEMNASTAPSASIVRQTRKYFRYQSGKGLQYSTGLNFSPNIDVSRITHDGTTYATVVTRRPHKLSVNNAVKIENVGFQDEYEATKCERDLAYLFNGAAFDVALGTNYNAIFLGIAEVNSKEISPSVVNAITISRNAVAQLAGVSASAAATTRSNNFWNEVLDIIANGRSSADVLSYPNPGTATASQIAAKERLINNRDFLAREVEKWVEAEYPNYDHDTAKCERDVKYAIDALVYDIIYGGNSATVDQARFFFYGFADESSTIAADHRLQTVAAYGRLKTIVGQVLAGTLVTKSAGNLLTQNTTGANAQAGEITKAQDLVQVTADVVNSTSEKQAIDLLPARVAPSVSWTANEFQTAKTAIETNAQTIIANIVRGRPYTTPVSGPFFRVNQIVDDFTFRYITNGLPYDLTPSGFPNLFVYAWKDAVVRAGMYDDQNGLFYEYDGQSLYAVRRSSTSQLGGKGNVTTDTRLITGVDTNFTKQLVAGEQIVVRGMSYKVTAVISNTEIHISPRYRGTTKNGVVITKTIDLRTPQKEWSIDPCDGTGPTGFLLDINRMQMAYIDYSWYGAGKVRYGFKGADGKVIYVHEYIHNNKEVEAYMRSGNLPARYEIKNGAAPTYAPSLYHWGASVIMDGQFEDDKAYLFTVASGSGGSDTISIPQTLAGIPVPILSIRLAPSVDSSLVGALGDRDVINRMQIALQQVGIVVQNANSRPASIRLILNGALAQQVYFNNYGSPSLTQIIKHTGQAIDSIVGGVTVYEFRATSSTAGNVTVQELGELIELGNSILGGDYVFPNGPDVITLAVVPTDTAAVTSVTARFTWKESQA